MCLPRSAGPSKLEGVGGVGVPGSWYETILHTSKNEEAWFGMDDCLGRTVRVLVAWYYLALTHPLSFFRFLVRYNMLWEGRACGLLVTVLFYPVYPFAAFFLLMARQALLPPLAYEANNVFFDPPKGALAAAVWSWYKALSPPTAQFMFNRGDPDAIAHSWWDHVTHKDFWRDHLRRVGARVPRELGRWEESAEGGGVWRVRWSAPLGKRDVVIKVLDESNGCGDAFLLHCDGAAAAGAGAGGAGAAGAGACGAGACDGTVTSEAAVEAYLASQPRYRNTKALVLEWIRPAEDQEVHTLDILTVAQPDGSIELVTLLYWGDCANGRTSHSTRAGYVVDAISEEIVSTCKWYAPGFAGMRPEPGRAFGIGHQLPGVAAACRLMVEAHRSAMREQPWLRMIGWDAMIARGGPPVFFEGNYAQMRTPRRVFLTWATLRHALATFC